MRWDRAISPRDYCQVEISSFRGFMKEPWPSSVSLEELLGEIGQPAGVVVKMRRCRAIKIREDLHVKEEFLRGRQDWPRMLKGLLHRSRLRRQWSAGLLARERGVPTPEPLAYLEGKRGLLPSRSLLVTRYESKYMTLTHYLREKVGKGTWARKCGESFLKELASAVRFMHEQGMLHCDLKGSNILVREDGEAWSFRFTDLKASRFRRSTARVFSPAGAARQDIIRLLATLRSFFSETDRRSFLHSYFSSSPQEAQRRMAEWEAEGLKVFPPRRA